MKAHRVLLIVTLVMVVVLAAVTPSVQAADEGFDLAVIAIESNPPGITVGQETSFIVSYQNVGSAAVPDIKLELLLLVTNKETNEEIGNCREEVSDTVSGLQPEEIEEYHFGKDCDVIFRAEGAHQVRVAFVPLGTSEEDAFSGSYPPIAGDANAANNGQTEDVMAGPYESGLPDELGRLFAGLGMFCAVMAIMAAGTEVVIDSIKVTLGLKSKVTALETLERMERLMPGQLATLGVGAASQEQFSNLTKKMRETVLPVVEIPGVVEKVKGGDIEAAFGLLKEFGVESSEIAKLRDRVQQTLSVTSADFGALRDTIVKAIQAAVSGLKQSTSILPSKILDDNNKEFLTKVEEQLVGIEGELANLSFPTVSVDVPQFIAGFKKLRDAWYALQTLIFHQVQTWSAQATADWLEMQRDDLVKLGHDGVLLNFDNYVVPQLKPIDEFLEALGISERKLVQEVRTRLEGALSALDAQAMAATDAYISSLSNLLQGVEARRFEIQSPTRKLWRRLRSAGTLWELLVLWPSLTILMALVIHIVQTARFTEWLFWPRSVVPGAVCSAILIPVSWGLGALIYHFSKAQFDEQEHSSSSASGWETLVKWLLVETVRPPTPLECIEVLWNFLRGNPDLDPTKFKKPKKFEKLAAVSATGDKRADEVELNAENAAQIVLLRTNQQQDEEKTRLRVLRVISVIVGMVLAYFLQIDAAVLLDQAVPGIGDTINRVLYISGPKLHGTWRWLASDRVISAGIILTGFAASAGSKFWHDWITQLQAAKKGAESAAELMNQAKQVVGSLEQNSKS